MPLSPSDLSSRCNRLLGEFPELRARAPASCIRNEFFRMAAIGFAMTCSLPWSERETSVLEPQDAEFDPELGEKWQSFRGLALGYFLGQYRAGEITELEFKYVLAVLPGFMFLHCPSLSGA